MGWTKSGLFYMGQLDQWDPSNLSIDLTAEDGKFALFGSSVTPNFASDLAYGSAPWNSGEASGAGYTAGGVLMANTTLAIVSNQLVWDMDNIQLTNSTITAEGGVSYWPNKSNRLFHASWFGEPKETQDGTFLITWASGGVVAQTLP